MPTSLDNVGVQAINRDACLSFYRRLSSTVSIVSAMRDKHGPLGLTVSAVLAVSVEPPLLSVCLAHTSRTLKTLLYTGRFGVHILQDDQRALANEFATRHSDRFVKHQFDLISGVPILSEVNTWSVCDVIDINVYGDRTMVVGQVIATQEGPRDYPLIWHDSHFLAINPNVVKRTEAPEPERL